VALAHTVTIAFDARYVNDRYHGIGRHAFNLAEALSRLDPTRRYLLFYNPRSANARFDWELLRQRPNVALRSVNLPLFMPHEQIAWPGLLARARASLFHSPYIALPLLARLPLVMTVHDLIFERFPDYMPRRWLRECYRALTRWGVRRAAAVLTVSETSRGDIETYYPGSTGKVSVIGNAVDAAFHRETDPSRLAAVRARYRLPERFVLALGAGRPHKNLGMLVDALAQLEPSLAPALVLAGDADTRFADEVQARVRVHKLDGRVVRAGSVREEDLATLYSLADLFIFPSLVEGFGLPVLEAMACGTPVAASTASSVPEVAGDAAIGFDPRDPAGLAAVVRRVLQDPALRADLAHRGLQRVPAFSWDGVARSTLEVYAALGL